MIKMHNKIGEALVFAAAGSVTYSWVADATQFTTFVASVIGIVTASMGAWYYFERAVAARMKRKEHKNNDNRKEDIRS